MSSAERLVRHHKHQTDRAISQAYTRLALSAPSAAVFDELLRCVRDRSRRLLHAPIVNNHHLGVEAIVNLARFGNAHVRAICNWEGSPDSWRPALSSLAHHLICHYAVPSFLAACWSATDEALAEKKREWYIRHARGASFRSLDLPIAMTRRMEHIFLNSSEHWAIEYAMRRAELVALGTPDEIMRAVLATPLALDLRRGEFWRTVWMFFSQNAQSIDPEQIGPMIDFIQMIRHERVAVETRNGIVMRDPPQPSFSMSGRTVRSMWRLMQEWHSGLGAGNRGLTWSPSWLRPMLMEEPSQDPTAPPTRWQLTELTTAAQLRAEGAALHHCVASYADLCLRGSSRIWALRVRRGDRVRCALTIEVDLKKRAVVQARGWRNRPASGKPLRLLREWAGRERLRLVF